MRRIEPTVCPNLYSHIVGFLEMTKEAEQMTRDDLTELEREPVNPAFPGRIVLQRQKRLIKFHYARRIRYGAFLAALAADTGEDAYPVSIIFQIFHADRHGEN